MATPLLQVKNLNIDFVLAANSGNRAPLVHAVRDVNFSIDAGEVLGLVGESGSGKSVTSLAIMRLLAPQARATGSILFSPTADTPDNTKPAESPQDLLQLPEAAMRSIRGRNIAMIFQEPMSALNPVMRVGDQIAEAVLAHTRVTKSEACRRAVDAMREVAIPQHERRARDYPHQLSGGMRQRIMIAMMLVNRPQLLIADEPTTALDVTIQAQILDLLNDLRQRFSLAMLFISHDLGVVSRVAERVAVMYRGEIVETGPIKQVFATPHHPYTKGLISAVPSLTTDRTKPLVTGI